MIADLKPYPAYKDSGVPWLGQVPEHWEVGTFRRRLRLYDGIKIGPFGSQLKLDQMTTSGYKVYGQANVIARDFDRGSKFVDQQKFEELAACELRAGDLVLTMMGTSGRCARVPDKAAPGIMDSHLLRLRTDASVDVRFVALVIDESPYVKEQILIAGKGSIMHGLNSSMVKDLILALPPLPEQSAIVRFLDHYDRKIRRYILAKQKLIKLLEEQKQVIIHRAVTRGLDPNVRLKPSGVEWLGDVPEHWEVRRNGRLFVQRNETGFADLPILEVSLRTGVRIRNFEESDRKQVMSDRDKYKRAVAGDITYNMMRMWQGAVGVAPTDGLISPAYVVAKPLPGTESRYFIRLFRTTAYMTEVDKYSRGIVKDRNRLYWEDFKRMPSCYPPPHEQVMIADAIDHACEDFDTAGERVHREISLLREYRTRLIADVVTGKLDVRGVIEAGNDLRSYPGLPEENGAVDDFAPGEDTETEEVVCNVEEALDE